MAKQNFDKDTVKKIAELAKLHLKAYELEYLTKQFNETLSTIAILNELDVEKIPGTFQVTGLTNVFRNDTVDRDRILSQKDALLNSHQVVDGFFAVEGILDEK